MNRDQMEWYPFSCNRPVDEEVEPEPWPVPDNETMQRRQAFRDNLIRETDDHRRIHPHGGMGNSGRNILHVLMDRERKGARTLTLPRQPEIRSESPKGDRSPSTVFESPISTTTPTFQAPTDEPNEMNPAEETEDDSSKMTPATRVSYPIKITTEVQTFAEYCSATKYHSSFLHHLGGDDVLDAEGNRPTSSRAVSTISVAFSPDAQTMASTHGDHTVKISCCNTGRLLQSLDGHPRTPWTVKYHPTDSRVVASGCLGHQVRVWNWVEKTCLQMVRLEFAIISLSFHPTGDILAVANGTRLHFWGIDSPDDKGVNENTRSNLLTEIDQRHMLRCVHFPPDGKTIIIGGVNPTTEDPRRRNRGGIGGGGMSFYLRLWDFDLNMALQRPSDSVNAGTNVPRRAISNPRTFVPRALLYNDGGFDVSPDGKTLCACAEYWLPEGVDNAMELLHREEVAYDAEIKEQESARTTEVDPAAAAEETKSAVSAALTRLKDMTAENKVSHGRSPSFRESMNEVRSETPTQGANTPVAQSSQPSNFETPTLDYVPRTPDNPRPPQPFRLSPPSPPGRRYAGGLRQGRESVSTSGSQLVPDSQNQQRGVSTPPPPPPPPPAPGGITSRPPHPLSMITGSTNNPEATLQMLNKGRYVPHVVTVSLDTTPIPSEVDLKLPRGKSYGAVAKGYRPRLGQLLEACPLDGAKASAVTCVKFSPSTDFCLIGYGVREPVVEGGGHFHPVTALYRVRGGMTHVSTMLSGDDDVNIARFHPDSGHGFVYGTKQGRVRVLSPRPWMYYNC